MSFTKQDLAISIIDDFCHENNIEPRNEENFGELAKYIGQSSSLAVALETLGVLVGDDAHYAASRAGVIYTRYDEKTKQAKVLTVRQLMALLS